MHGARLVWEDGSLSLEQVAVMGILNVTPDSFSDGGMWLEPEGAVKHGVEMVRQGAAIIDVGGESTRPGADEVPLEEELRRVLPVIAGLREAVDVPVSIDTRKPEVARRAVAEGAVIVNDTTGEAATREMDEALAATGAAVVIMHSRGTPATMKQLTDYEDVVADVAEVLQGRADALAALGLPREAIALDPGIGFAKTPAQSLQLLRRLDTLTSLPYPVLVGTSRKSFIGATLGLAEGQRVEATIATCILAITAGAKILRVHDVEPVVRATRMAEAVLSS